MNKRTNGLVQIRAPRAPEVEIWSRITPIRKQNDGVNPRTLKRIEVRTACTPSLCEGITMIGVRFSAKLYVSIFEIPRFRHPRLSNPRIDAKFEIVVQRAPWDRSQLPNRPKRIAVTKQKVGRSLCSPTWQRMLKRMLARRCTAIIEKPSG